MRLLLCFSRVRGVVDVELTQHVMEERYALIDVVGKGLVIFSA